MRPMSAVSAEWGGSAACRLKEGLAQVVVQADELRLHAMQQMAALLSPRQLAYYLLAPMDMLQLG